MCEMDEAMKLSRFSTSLASSSSAQTPLVVQSEQPTSGTSLDTVQISTSCPSGLDCLSEIDQLYVHQHTEGLEALLGWETCIRYKVFNSRGQQIFYAFEELPMLSRMICGKWREFTVHIVKVDNKEANKEVIRLIGTPQEILIEAPPASLAGYAVQDGLCWSSSFQVLDARRSPLFCIDGPSTLCGFPCDEYDFDVVSARGASHVGRITKQYSGFMRETFTDADNFAVSFPIDLDVRQKASMLGVLFLIDFMLFEQSGQH